MKSISKRLKWRQTYIHMCVYSTNLYVYVFICVCSWVSEWVCVKNRYKIVWALKFVVVGLIYLAEQRGAVKREKSWRDYEFETPRTKPIKVAMKAIYLFGWQCVNVYFDFTFADICMGVCSRVYAPLYNIKRFYVTHTHCRPIRRPLYGV